jgi:hypothetical protein
LTSLITDCGGQIISHGSGGIIASPGFPEKYKSRTYCRWTIKASSPFNDILVYFFVFHTEGTGKSSVFQSQTHTVLSRNTVLTPPLLHLLKGLYMVCLSVGPLHSYNSKLNEKL